MNESNKLRLSQQLSANPLLKELAKRGLLQGVAGAQLPRYTRLASIGPLQPLTHATLERFNGYARNEFEGFSAHFYGRIAPEHLSLPQDLLHARFAFLAFCTPTLASFLIKLAAKRNKGQPPLWAYEWGTYVIALERMHLEMVLRCSTHPYNERCGRQWERPARAEELAQLPMPTLSWFLEPPGEVSFWMRRFDEWLRAARRSFTLYMRMKCRDLEDLPPAQASAAFWGTLENNSLLPSEIIPELRAYLGSLHGSALSVFHRNAHKPLPREDCRQPELDTWLVEIRPLAVEAKWQAPDLLQIARKKFGDQAAALQDVNQMYERCRRLGWSFGRGRPRQTNALGGFFPPLALLPVFLDSIYTLGNEWICGQRELYAAKNRF